MTFIHEDSEFPQLLAMVGQASGLDEPLVEKDYWITLWSRSSRNWTPSCAAFQGKTWMR